MGSCFDEEGFLSDETDNIKDIIFKCYPNTFKKCQEVNAFAYQFRNAITLNYENPLHLILICFLQKVIDSFQSVILLMSLGLEEDSETITRSSIEAMFQIRKLVLDNKYIDRYIGSDQLRIKKLLNVAKSKPQSILSSILKGSELEKKLEEINDDIKRNCLSEISIEKISHDVGLEDWYDLVYRVLSEGAHAGPRSLEKYLQRDENDDVTIFDFNPKCNRLTAVVITQASIVLIVLDSLEKVFHCGYKKHIDELFESIRDFKE